jgi:hypothetical protein
MTKIIDTTQTRLTRFLMQFAGNVDQRDALRSTDWRSPRWHDGDARARGL